MASTRAPELAGREEELAAIAAFLAARDELPGALLLEGEAGIGKTTLFELALAAARGDEDYRVLACTPAGSEQRLAYAGAGDLLTDVLDEVLPALPAPQARALRVVLLLEEAGGRPPDRHAAAAGFLGALRILAREAPVLLAVDDVQWLDPESASLVEFAARRLRDEQVALLCSERTERPGAIPLGLDRALPEGRLVRLHVGPLSAGALHHLISRRTGVGLSRPALRRVHEVSGGNPFFALELARALQRNEAGAAPGGELHVPGSLRELVEERLASLPAETQESLLVAASVSAPTTELVEAAVGRPPGLEPAVDAQVIEVDGGRIRFTHPLLQSGVRARAPAARRRDVHRTLARLVPSTEERARQLALATDEPDETVAATLHLAGRSAAERGAPGVAAELFEHALRVTPEDATAARFRRTLEASGAHFEAGDTSRAVTLLEELVAATPPGRDRGEALWWLAVVKAEVSSLDDALGAFEAALEEASGDVELQASIHCQTAWLEACGRDQDAAMASARAAIELAERASAPDLLPDALASAMFVTFMRGERDEELAARALELERAGGRVRIDRCPSTVRGYQLMYGGELDAARVHFESVLALAHTRGDESNASAPLFSLANIAVLSGDWDVAEDHVREAEERAEQTGVNRLETVLARTFLDIHRGKADEARTAALAVVEEARAAGEGLSLMRALERLGFVELSCGDPAATHAWLAQAAEVAAAMQLRAPGYVRFLADDAEALLALGDLDAAEAVLVPLEERARALDHAWALSMVERSRGLILAARGDTDAALVELESALARQAGLGMPFERARTLLALGQTQRRAKQRRAARESLGEALTLFDGLGSPLWADRTRVELARIGGRAAGDGELTPTERRVAELVADGRSNKEAAAELFVSVKAVEANLSRVYAKLGVRSRSELARKL